MALHSIQRRSRAAILTSATIALLVGAAWTVLTSWAGFRAYTNASKRSIVFIGADGLPHREALREVSVPLAWPIAVPSDWPAALLHAHATAGFAWRNTIAENHGSRDLDCYAQHSGWPCLAMVHWFTITGPNKAESQRRAGDVVQSPLLRPDRFTSILGPDALPIVPVWPGFAVNTLAYAALAWGLWQIPVRLRRRSRIKRGRCAGCGYSLAGLGAAAPCPECGAARTSEAIGA